MPFWLQYYLQWIDAEWLDTWFGKVLLLSPLIVAVIVLWLVARLVYLKSDRQSHQSCRCRKCGYDLRGTPASICSECGHDLSRRGTWKAGYPNNVALLDWMAVWSILLALAAGPAAVEFKNACVLCVMTGYLNDSGVGLFHPASKQYDRVSIAPVYGPMRLVWPWMASQATPVTQLEVVLLGNKKTIRLQATRTQLVLWSNWPSPPVADPVPRTADQLITLMQKHLGAIASPELDREAAFIMNCMIRTETDGFISSGHRHSIETRIETECFGYATFTPFSYLKFNAPWSVIWVPLTASGVIWLAGVIALRHL